MANFLTKLFKTKAGREIEVREEQAKLARAEDMGRQVSQTVISLIDAFRDQKLVPSVRDVLRTFKLSIDSHHKDATPAAAINVLAEFKSELENWKNKAFIAVWDSLSEWKYSLIELGIKDTFDKYINEMIEVVWVEADKLAVGETAYCVTRISGHITDEMHVMTPEELERYARTNKLGRFRET